MNIKKTKYVVVGAGTAGIIAATYLATIWKNEAEVILVYDKNKPIIGVGESLTPNFLEYLEDIGISEEELIQNVNATLKLSMRFVNWTGDGSDFYHTFFPYGRLAEQKNTGMLELARGDYEKIPLFQFLNTNRIPKIINKIGHSMHVDAMLLSKYIENKFKDKITVINGNVEHVSKVGVNVDCVVLEDGHKIYGDYFIDATGFQSIIFKNLDTKWIDKSDWLPLNSFIPSPVEVEHKEIPPYSIAEATDNGWILQVPLANRWGSGYLYCSDFLSDDQAFDNFSIWSKKKYGVELTDSGRRLRFKSGYWDQQWVGNCIAVGLCSGFAEPLEATNIHHTIRQVSRFCLINNGTTFDFDRVMYNKEMNEFYENIYHYIRYCYCGNRQDSEFWKYMYYNIPEEVKYIAEKLENDPYGIDDGYLKPMFSLPNFAVIAYGLKRFGGDSVIEILRKRRKLDKVQKVLDELQQQKFNYNDISWSHKDYITNIKNKKS
jgi:tryptophan halogenase